MTSKQICDREKTPALDCDLIIVGGGISGATLACALQDSGLRITLIEARPLEVVAAKRQAYALTLLSGGIFAGLGVWDEILPQITQFQQIRLSDADYPQIVNFHPQDLGTGQLGYVAEHEVVLTALQEKLNAAPNVRWCCPAQVEGVEYGQDAVTVTVTQEGKEKTLRSRLLVGADGARSRIRQDAGIKTQGWKYWQSCVAFTIRHQNPQNDIAYERFCYSGPMGILPLPGNRCQIVWTEPHEEAKTLQKMPEAAFLERLRERTGGIFSGLELASDRFLFPVQLMQSEQYTQSRLALIGDAAHCCHPVGGQGLNLGIRDASALAEVLQTALQQGEDIGNAQVLHRYEQWRQGENWVILGFTDFLDRMFSNDWLPLMMSRRLGLWMLQNIQPMKQFALALMTGLKGRRPQLAKF
ncbi:FAD-dependent hydroxylase [Spirulina sp. CS-785/01]|uniref:FAD-dependent hydroxylase n=1 Tax=Spirulina sp. CS-785/01 TaxID=3021716 RepID=UPI0023305DF7|nr:FAD-dependent hydroxylase [Spirulina sp. CS-785/01]MDB9315079.1 FAD-dependent hydroxylase [Spirulina sp. CS-785/01]